MVVPSLAGKAVGWWARAWGPTAHPILNPHLSKSLHTQHERRWAQIHKLVGDVVHGAPLVERRRSRAADARFFGPAKLLAWYSTQIPLSVVLYSYCIVLYL